MLAISPGKGKGFAPIDGRVEILGGKEVPSKGTLTEDRNLLGQKDGGNQIHQAH